jgi:hypothetical protein
MKITFQPDISSWKCEVYCHQCTSKMEINGDDLRHKVEKRSDWDERLEENYTYNANVYYIACPVCSGVLEVNSMSTKMPYLLCQKVQERSKKGFFK